VDSLILALAARGRIWRPEAMTDLGKKYADYRLTLGAARHLPKATNDAQEINNYYRRNALNWKWRNLCNEVPKALEMLNDPNTPEEVSAEILALMEAPDVQQILRDMHRKATSR
jgi:hypothetical protein